jgi:hypothetical protein
VVKKNATCCHLNSLNFLAEFGGNIYFVVYFTFSISQTRMPNDKILGKHVEVNIVELI